MSVSSSSNSFKITITFTHFLYKSVSMSQKWVYYLISYLNYNYLDSLIKVTSFDLPIKSKKHSILKSPHVYSKFREVIRQDLHRKGIVIILTKKEHLMTLLSVLKKVSTYLTSNIKIRYEEFSYV